MKHYSIHQQLLQEVYANYVSNSAQTRMPGVTVEHECSCDRRVSITTKYPCVAKHWPPQHHTGKSTTATTTPKKSNEDSPNTRPSSQLNTASQGTRSLATAGPVYPCSKNYSNSLLPRLKISCNSWYHISHASSEENFSHLPYRLLTQLSSEAYMHEAT